jgi:hypothetical protein
VEQQAVEWPEGIKYNFGLAANNSLLIFFRCIVFFLQRFPSIIGSIAFHHAESKLQRP